MLCGQQEVLEAVARAHVGPLLGHKAHGIERAIEVDILLAEYLGIVLPIHIPARPRSVLVAQRPRFTYAHLSIWAKMHHQRQLLILEPLQALAQQFILGRYVVFGRAAAVHTIFNQVCHCIYLPSTLYLFISTRAIISSARVMSTRSMQGTSGRFTHCSGMKGRCTKPADVCSIRMFM